MRDKCTNLLVKSFCAVCILWVASLSTPAATQASASFQVAQRWSDPAHKVELRRKLDEFRYPENRQSAPPLPRYVRNPERQFVPELPLGSVIVTLLVIFSAASLFFLTSKSTVQKGSTRMSAEPSSQEFDIKPTFTNVSSDSDSRVETWRDAALFFAVAASSALMFSKLGFKIVSACAAIRIDTPTRGFDAMWIVRILAALFVACISVYFFKRVTRDTESALRNSLACNVGLAFAAVALLLTHSNGIQIISFVGDCVRIVPGAPNQF